ncbi:hypothetical protein [Actinoalloteichus fjordicus]|uniref:hypothetical protein n=1 Tax=Actinoalloteichus fjordicus TaxID=1612552 RepID=UPI00095233E0|nr:hypothetical protein [Actinoalloteichus fjordicus]
MVEYLIVGEQALAGCSHLVFFVVFMATINGQYVYPRASTTTRLATALLQGMTAIGSLSMCAI